MIQPDQIIYSNRKSLSLEIREDGTFCVHAPRRMPLEEIQSFVTEKQDWIQKKLTLRKLQLSKAGMITYAEYSTIPFLSNELMILYHSKKEIYYNWFFLYLPKPALRISSIQLITPILPDEVIIAQNKSLIRSFFCEVAYSLLLQRTDYYAALMELSYSSIKITKARTCWGSCNVNGGINYSYHLVSLSLYEIDYVIVHELSHIRHRNHSTDFYKEIQKILPDYKKRIASLKENLWVLEIF